MNLPKIEDEDWDDDEDDEDDDEDDEDDDGPLDESDPLEEYPSGAVFISWEAA